MFFSLPKWKLSSTKLVVLLSLYFSLVMNYAFYREILTLQPLTNEPSAYFLYTIPLALFFGMLVVFQILSMPILHKVIIPLLLILSAAANYNSVFYNVYFNTDMINNILQTTPAEASRLVNSSSTLWLIGFGIIPAILYLLVKVEYKPFWKELRSRLAVILIGLIGILAVAKFFYQDYASFFRNNKSLTHLIVPSNFVASSFQKVRQVQQANLPYTQQDTHIKQQKFDRNRHVTVLVLGETTRAQNWGLNGYERQTTPNLAKRGDEIINFTEVSSCGTATAASVPCMFSSFTRTEYEPYRAEKQDNILDIIQRAGIDVRWYNNSTDCKGVCNRVKTIDIPKDVAEYCRAGECLDNILLPELDKVLAEDSQQDILLVLHTMGNHGPTYYERYTEQYRQFTPDCQTNEINRCTPQQIVNTYDNGILYIDQFIDNVIKRLENKDNWESTVYYISDHGESLGEDGIYLHSAPYAIAPATQTRIPMTMWFSKAFRQNEKFNFDCLQTKAKTESFSQDNLYHTMFSIMDIDPKTSTTYQPELDILNQCRVK